MHNSKINSSAQKEDHLNFNALLNLIIDSRWLIGTVTAITMALSVAYAYLAQPVYEANMLIQVEQNRDGPTSSLGQMSALFNVESPATAELEILRSRLVIGRAVEALKLYINASPDYIPVIGKAISKYRTENSNPGVFGFGNHVSGRESISVETLDVPSYLEGEKLSVYVIVDGFRLTGPDGIVLTEGTVKVPAIFTYKGQQGQILVTELEGEVGARFIVTRDSSLKIITSLQNQLSIGEKGKQSGMIYAKLEGTNRERTKSVLNAIGSAYVRQNIERKSAEAEKSLIFLDSFLPELRTQMEEAENHSTKFRDQHGTFDLGAEAQLSLESSVRLQTKLIELQQKRRELSPRFQANHPTIKTIDQQIGAIESEMHKIESSVRKMPDLEQQLLSLTRDVQVRSELYVSLLNSAQQLRLVKEGKVGNVRLVDIAEAPENPVKPKKALILIFGTLLGSLFGVGAAILRARLNAGVMNPSEIESTLGLSVIATIPFSQNQESLQLRAGKKQLGQHILATQEPKDAAIESLRSLRTLFQFALLNAKSNVVLITSPTPGAGKSFVSVNFSAIWGSADKKILLIDADLRKGYINQYFGLDRHPGLSDAISGTPINEVVRRNVMKNVDLITTGTIPPNPSELLLSSKTAAIINELAPKYDLVLIDSAPVLAVGDALALATYAGAVFLLARAEMSTLGELVESQKRLTQIGAQVNGIILNGVIPSKYRYGSKYGQYQYADYKYESI